MKRILFTNKYTNMALSIMIEELPSGFIPFFLAEQTQNSLLEAISSADYLVAGGRIKITAEALDKAARIKMIQRSGVGLDSIDLSAIKERNIPLYVNHGVNAESVAEHTLLLILACLRRLTIINQNTKNGIWEKQNQGVLTTELKGKTVGIIGMGNIAKTLVALLKPFGVRILYYDLMRQSLEFENDNHMSFVGITDLLSNSDIVACHCSLTTETRGLINSATINSMKDGAVLINTARGEVVDPNALAEALKSGKLSFAALDVHVSEPFPNDYPLKDIENVILTPHIAGVTADSFRTMMHDAFRNIQCFENGDYETIAPYRYM